MNAYLLCGGRSSRMGRPKESVLLGGRSFADRIIDACEPVFDEVVAITRADAEPLDRVRTIHERPHEGTSPMYGVEAALEDAGDDRVWVLAVDYPLVTSELLRWLAARFEASGGAMLVPRWGDKPQMLCAGYAPSVRADLARRIADGRFRLRDLIGEHRARIVEESEIRGLFPGEQLRNVNTRADLDEIVRLVAGRGGSDGGIESSR